VTCSGSSPPTLRDALHGFLRGTITALHGERHARLARPVVVLEDLLVLDGEVDLHRFDVLHLADGAFEFALERAAVVDLLREVRHAPRGLVEQLETGAAGVGRLAGGEVHAGAGEIVVRHQDRGAGAIEFVRDARLGKLVGHRLDLLHRHVRVERDHRGGGCPARHAEHERGHQHADRDDRRLTAAAETAHDGIEEGVHGGVGAQDCMAMTLR
jgi:hypothetical protein